MGIRKKFLPQKTFWYWHKNHRTKMKLNLTFFVLFLAVNLFAQENEHNHEHEHSHDTHRNEIGVAGSTVYFMNEKAFAYGLHVHYSHSIPKTKFGVGLGYERIFGEHKHNTFGIVGTYRPIERLNINISPGFTVEDNSSQLSFALHVETSYEFEIKNFHIGPALEFAYDPEDYHISFGVHVGIGF